jgi:tRNA modification GTPase
LLVERLVDQGARLAEPGEFTRRAFVNGRLDLAQAEAVALLIGARTERAVTLAARAVAGELSRRVSALRAGVLDAVASLEVSLDFPDDAGLADIATIASKIKQLRDGSESLLAASRRGMIAHTGLTVAIAGAPNAGKSSLFNALLGRDRAIVTPEAGTTRDVIEGTISLCGVPVRLLDTAGIGVPRDAIDAEGMRRARQAIAESDVVLLVVDGSRACAAPAVPEAVGGNIVIARSKSDLGLDPDAPCPPDSIPTSVVAAGGLDRLLDRLRAAVGARSGREDDESPVTASMRQVELIQSMTASLASVDEALGTQPIEILLIELRSALEAASSVLGIEVGDAVLDAIFSRFCVGK